jgi:hypothetical protein
LLLTAPSTSAASECARGLVDDLLLARACSDSLPRQPACREAQLEDIKKGRAKLPGCAYLLLLATYNITVSPSHVLTCVHVIWISKLLQSMPAPQTISKEAYNEGCGHLICVSQPALQPACKQQCTCLSPLTRVFACYNAATEITSGGSSQEESSHVWPTRTTLMAILAMLLSLLCRVASTCCQACVWPSHRIRNICT